MSRDTLWLSKSYGEWKGLARPALTDAVTAVPTQELECLEIEVEDDEDEAVSIVERSRRLGSPRKATTPSNKSSGREASFMEPVEQPGRDVESERGREKQLDAAHVVEPADLDAVQCPVFRCIP